MDLGFSAEVLAQHEGAVFRQVARYRAFWIEGVPEDARAHRTFHDAGRGSLTIHARGQALFQTPVNAMDAEGAFLDHTAAAPRDFGLSPLAGRGFPLRSSSS